MYRSLVMVCLVIFLAACSTVQWQRVDAIARQADMVAATWQAALPANEAAVIAEVREAGVPILAALAAKAADPNAPDPTASLSTWLALADQVALQWPNAEQRPIALALLSTTRLALVASGVNLQ